MRDLFPKYIIEDGNLILSKVSFHKEMICDPDKVQGGGWFRYNSETKTFTFHGDSHDFGQATLEDVTKAVKECKVFNTPACTRNLTERYNFAYHTGSESILLDNPNKKEK